MIFRPLVIVGSITININVLAGIEVAQLHGRLSFCFWRSFCSIMAIVIYISTSNAEEFPFLYILSSGLSFGSIAIPTRVGWYLIVV